MTGVGAPAGKVQPDAHRSPWRQRKAVAKVTEDQDELLAFYDYPAEHWAHLRTTNPIESTSPAGA